MALDNRTISRDHDDADVLVQTVDGLDIVGPHVAAQTVVKQYHIWPYRLRRRRIILSYPAGFENPRCPSSIKG